MLRALSSHREVNLGAGKCGQGCAVLGRWKGLASSLRGRVGVGGGLVVVWESPPADFYQQH